LSWSSVIGQERVKELLKASLRRGRLAHAYLFSGPEGSGKYAAALELSKIVNCADGTSDACDGCPSCKKFLTLQHPNLHLVFSLPVGKSEKSNDPPLSKLSNDDITAIQEQLKMKTENLYHSIFIPRANTIKINSIRDIRREASLTAFDKGKKVFIIIDAEKMSDEAANALLKTLEEPHQDTLLILLTSKPDLLLRTIISRCQLIHFDSLTDEAVAGELHKQKNVDLRTAGDIARLSGGNLSRALEYVEGDFSGRQSLAIDILRILLYKPNGAVVDTIEGLVRDYERDQIEDILHLIEQWLRDAMLLNTNLAGCPPALATEPLTKFVARYPQFDYVRSIDALDKAVSLIGKNVYIPLIMLDLTAKLRDCAGG